MIKTTQKGSMTEISVEAPNILHKIGSADYPEIRRINVKAEQAGQWEEVAYDQWQGILLDRYKAAEYSKRLSAAIHERYSIDDEIALAANVNSPMLLDDEGAADAIAEEYAAYQAYRAECKARVRAEIDAITEIPAEPIFNN